MSLISRLPYRCTLEYEVVINNRVIMLWLRARLSHLIKFYLPMMTRDRVVPAITENAPLSRLDMTALNVENRCICTDPDIKRVCSQFPSICATV